MTSRLMPHRWFESWPRQRHEVLMTIARHEQGRYRLRGGWNPPLRPLGSWAAVAHSRTRGGSAIRPSAPRPRSPSALALPAKESDE